MKPILLDATSNEDARFVCLVSAFASHYANLYRPPRLVFIQIDHWFGRKWLGFKGKLLGALGVHADVSDSDRITLPKPPFSPTRVQSSKSFVPNGNEWEYDREFGMHEKKNGGAFRNINRRGLYCWYSGGTVTNTHGSLMVYDVNEIGANGWYIGFALKNDWQLVDTVNVSRDECARVMATYAAFGTEQSDPPKSLFVREFES